MPRHSTEADVLAGHAIEPDTELLVCPYLTHRDPELWDDPEEFDPTRFTDPGRRPDRPGGYYPFGAGPRACLGLQFALRESTALLEELLPAPAPRLRSVPARAAYSITVRPDGPVTALLGT
ncbi:cytochrome P450 [Streptomyces sp. SBR177]